MELENQTESRWNGWRQISFTVEGRESFVICPEKAAPGAPWVWRCEFFGAFDAADRALLRMGWHLAYHRVSDLYGCPEAIEKMHAFYAAVTEALGLSRQAVLFGFSRGGLYAVNYAARYPYETSLVYLDAPVLDIRSWPCGPGGDAHCAEECLHLYGLTPETLADFRGNAMEQAETLSASRIPVLIVAGGADATVPYHENGKIFAERMRAAGGIVETIVKPDCGHHPHSLADPRPITDWILSHTDFAPRLPNTICRLTVGKRLTVGYFGGSITENGGSDVGWRARTTAWLRAHYPDAEITEVQAAIGGTGTALGMYRCDRDLLAHRPDLVFVEFAVNDFGDRRSGAQTETILRKILHAVPTAEIVVVFTLTKHIADELAAGRPYGSRDVQSALARAYGLPTVNIGDALGRAVRREYGGDWTPLAPDGVHPNADGYRYCFEEMEAFLASALRGGSHTLRAQPLPAPLQCNLLPDARLTDAAEAVGKGFTLVEKSMCRRYPHYLEGTSGASLTLRFTGTTVGVYWMMAHDAGRILAAVDGGKEKCVTAWDSYCLRFDRAGSAILFRDLQPGEHTLTLRVADETDEKSDGRMIRIGAFLVG